ncbi:RES family NAD+ phosphorylase [Streptomyces olivaceus]|uniref:RES family NAD+ phosphorylase n=1 Tax=Streptomyces olivaceus TaxID=47716 RepID=UPI0037B7356E
MGLHAPPEGVAMEPLLTVLPAGSLVWRCHRHHYGAAEFNPRPAHEYFKGSRFDATERDPYPYLYAALDPLTALAEVFLRSVEYGSGSGVRLIPWAQASQYRLSALRTTDDITLLDLTTAEGLASVWQDEWLVDCEEREYDKTRYWVRVMRRHCGTAQGLRWMSKRCRPRAALQFFGDRGKPWAADGTPQESWRLDSEEGVDRANRLLGDLRAVISVPSGGSAARI